MTPAGVGRGHRAAGDARRVDVAALKHGTDLLALIGRHTRLRRIAATRGGEYAGACPFCGGTDRLHVQPAAGVWRCRRCSPADRWEDGVAFVARRDGVPFREAVRRLRPSGPDGPDGAPIGPAPHPLRTSSNASLFLSAQTPTIYRAERNEHQAGPAIAAPLRPPAAPAAGAWQRPAAAWRAAAERFLARCEAALWSPAGERARTYLHDRGLRDATLRAWRVGWSPHERRVPAAEWGLHAAERPVWLPRGIVLPWLLDGEPWELRVRRRGPDPAAGDVAKAERYRKVRGGRAVLFGADRLAGRRAGVLTEGEFDALLLWQEAGDLVGVATLGSASQGLDECAAQALLPLSPILVAYDPDAGGRAGAAALLSRSRRMRRAAPPGDGDLTECWRAGASLRDWVRFHLARFEALAAAGPALPPVAVTAPPPPPQPEPALVAPPLTLRALLATLQRAGAVFVVTEDEDAPGGERLRIVEPAGGLSAELRTAVAARRRQLADVVRGRFASALPLIAPAGDRERRPAAPTTLPAAAPAGRLAGPSNSFPDPSPSPTSRTEPDTCELCAAVPGTRAVRTWRDREGRVYRLCARHFAPLTRVHRPTARPLAG